MRELIDGLKIESPVAANKGKILIISGADSRADLQSAKNDKCVIKQGGELGPIFRLFLANPSKNSPCFIPEPLVGVTTRGTRSDIKTNGVVSLMATESRAPPYNSTQTHPTK